MGFRKVKLVKKSYASKVLTKNNKRMTAKSRTKVSNKRK